MTDQIDPAEDAIDRAKHGLSLLFGARIFDDDHLIIPSVRPIDGEERFEVVGRVEEWPFTWWNDVLASFPSEGATEVKSAPVTLPADPSDAEDFDVTTKALDRGQRARLIRRTRMDLGLSRAEFASRFRVRLGTSRDREQAPATAPDFAVAHVRVIERMPGVVAEAIA